MPPTPFICTVGGARALTDLGTPPNSVTSVILTDVGGTFPGTEFFAVDEAKREILAVALAAISNSYKVHAVVDPPTGVGDVQCYSLQVDVP